MYDIAAADMLDEARRAIGQATVGDSIGIAFSGGVDSTLLARICGHMYNATLLTIGMEGSHDVTQAASAARFLGMPHHTHIIQPSMLAELCSDERFVFESISWTENAISFHVLSEVASNLGLGTLMAANGIDELYCGYDSYRRIYGTGKQAVLDMIRNKMSNETLMMRAIASIVGENVVQPFMEEAFVEYSYTIPLYEKIRGGDDYIRKHIVRRAAELSGLPPEICWRRKKAMQYGSGIHRHVLKSRRHAAQHSV